MIDKSTARQASKHRRRDEGVTALEYALIAGLIALGIVAGARIAGTSAGASFTNVGTQLQAAAR